MWAAALLALAVCAVAARAEETEKPLEIIIYGSTPVPGTGQPRDRLPTNVLQLYDDDLNALAPRDATDALGRRAPSVHLEQTQNNPYQPDLLYRGFTSSFLLGTPQGISVFQDGVRLNDFLGDAMNWDLVPEASLETIELVPGANPIYGRNTLGGAIALGSKSGRTDPGTSAEVSYGSFERLDTSLTHAGTAGAEDAFDYLVTGDFGREDGFRDFSRSRVARVFLRGGWRDPDGTAVWATYNLARNKLRGNGSVPESMLDEDRGAVFTQPDVFDPDLDFVTVHVAKPLGGGLRFDGAGYYRSLGIRQLNADAAEEEEDDGVVNRTRIDQRRFGGTLQATHVLTGETLENFFVAGFEGEGGDADVRLTQQPGTLTENRGVDATGEPELETDVTSRGHSLGTYASDTVTPLSWLSLTGSLRYDRTHVSIDNRLEPESSGAHTFERVNPAAGVNVRLGSGVDLFGHYGESFRAPSAIELSCASEDDPCPLPVAFADDPPLKKVVAHGYEVGAHAEPMDGMRASVAFFLTKLDDDILFVSSSRARGFFRNVDETRRMGVEANAQGRWRFLTYFLSYSFTRATFESTVSLPSAAGENLAHPGDELPGVPRHLFKTGADVDLPLGFRFGADLQFTGRQFLRGDESNEREPLSSYTVVNARLSYTYGHVTLFARAENLLDTEHETFGTFGENVFAGGTVERFLSPGAPLGGWFGVRVDL